MSSKLKKSYFEQALFIQNRRLSLEKTFNDLDEEFLSNMKEKEEKNKML